MAIIFSDGTAAEAAMPAIARHPKRATNCSETLYTVQDFAADIVTCHAAQAVRYLHLECWDSRIGDHSLCSISVMTKLIRYCWCDCCLRQLDVFGEIYRGSCLCPATG